MEDMTNDESNTVDKTEKDGNITKSLEESVIPEAKENDDFKNMDFEALYNSIQRYISSHFAALLGGKSEDSAVKEQLINIITRYIKDRKIILIGVSVAKTAHIPDQLKNIYLAI